MLYPSEDRERKELVFACRTCMYSEAPSSSCVYRNDLSNTVGDTAGITQDVGQDPTVGLNILELCTVCGEEITCEKCGEPAAIGCWLEVNDDEFEAETATRDNEMDLGYVSDPISDDDYDEYELTQIQEMVQNLGLLPVVNGNAQSKNQNTEPIQHDQLHLRGQHT
jgi:DNA-directed RNA polymerase II subunit RPB9